MSNIYCNYWQGRENTARCDHEVKASALRNTAHLLAGPIVYCKGGSAATHSTLGLEPPARSGGDQAGLSGTPTARRAMTTRRSSRHGQIHGGFADGQALVLR